jgi:hypothetical protein
MAGKAWFSLRPNQIIKRVKAAGWKDFSDIYLGTTVRLMPEPMSVIGDDNWDGKGNFLIKVNEKNFNWITTSKVSPFYGKESKDTQKGKEKTYEIYAGKVKGGKAEPLKIRFRKSGKLTKSVAGTQEQELGSAFIFRRALNDNAGWKEWQDIVKDDDTYPELVKIFKGSVPDSWLISYFAQSKVLLDEVKPPKMSEFNRDGGFMGFITGELNRKFGISKKDTWNPADIWIINGNLNNIKQRIKNKIEGKNQTIQQLNGVLRKMFHDEEVMGISLKKTGPIAYYEKVNLEGLIPDTKEDNFDVPMTDFKANFMIESTGMFTQDVKIVVDAVTENKTFTFQIKANDSGASGGSNLKFEPTAKGAGLARLGKAPVDEVAEILKDMNQSSSFVNKYQEYPKDEVAFSKTNKKKGEEYFRNQVLPALTRGPKKITSDISDIDQIIKNIKASYGSKDDRGTNTRCKLMGLDFFYQVSKLDENQRNEFVTDMIFLAQKKAFGKRPDFGPFGKIY